MWICKIGLSLPYKILKNWPLLVIAKTCLDQGYMTNFINWFHLIIYKCTCSGSATHIKSTPVYITRALTKVSSCLSKFLVFVSKWGLCNYSTVPSEKANTRRFEVEKPQHWPPRIAQYSRWIKMWEAVIGGWDHGAQS